MHISALRLVVAGGLAAAPGLGFAQTLTTLHPFGGGDDGAFPAAPLIYLRGALFGTTFQGGRSGCYGSSCGTVFEVNATTGAEAVVHAFADDARDGGYPEGGLWYQAGALYGATELGGTVPQQGTLYKIDLAGGGAETVLHDFTGSGDGGDPTAGLTGVAGTLYGVTAASVFSADARTGAVTTLHPLGGAQGELPLGPLTYADGFLYGTSYEGGAYSAGEVFKIDVASGVFSIVYSFTGGADGGGPTGVLSVHGGVLYGATNGGGRGCSYGCGTVFAINLRNGLNNGQEKVVYAFTGRADGDHPAYGVIYVQGGLYGTDRGARAGCETNGCGTVFRVDARSGVATVLHRFTGGADGGLPQGGVIYADGAFYGTTGLGGDLHCGQGNGCGTVFRLTP